MSQTQGDGTQMGTFKAKMAEAPNLPAEQPGDCRNETAVAPKDNEIKADVKPEKRYVVMR